MKALTIIITAMMMNTCNGNVAKEPTVRPATQADRFYTGDARELSEEVDSLLALHAGDKQYADLAAVIVPHASYYFSGNVAAAAFMSIPKDVTYKRIFLLGPSHHEWFDGASVNTEFDYYSTPLGNVKVDIETAQKLIEADSVFSYHPKAHDREHCLEVQLPFLQRQLKEVPPIVPIIISTNDFRKLKRIAETLKPYLTEDRSTEGRLALGDDRRRLPEQEGKNLFVISSDFSHYPKYEDAYEVDSRTGKAIESGNVERFIDVLEENARSGVRNLATSACGELAIATLLLMIQDGGYEVKHLLYQNSGDIDNHERQQVGVHSSGMNSRVVGYHAFAIIRNGLSRTGSDFMLSDDEKRILKEIALTSIQDSLDGKRIAEPTSLTATLKQKCGAFVSLHKQGRLRGCIGHFGEGTPLHEIVAEMARAAAFEDPRFSPVRKEELEDIDIEISVLTPMRRIKSLDEFELHRHGIYIRKGYRSGTFLPQVADEVNWTKEEFVSHCAQDKAGIGWNGWKDAELYIYEAIVF